MKMFHVLFIVLVTHMCVKIHQTALLNSMHLIEDVLQLALHLHACVDAQFAQFSRDIVKRLLALSHVNYHHHVEILLHDSLRNVEDVYLIVCQIGADLSNDTHRILAHNCNNCSCHILFVNT